LRLFWRGGIFVHQNHSIALCRADHLRAVSAQVAEARSDYYPQLSARLGNEYVRVHGAAGNVVSVGDAILADNASGYKHSLTFSAQYTLYDFGRRSLNFQYAEGRRRVVELEREQVLRRVRQQVVELYGQALKQQKRLEVQRLRQEALVQVYRFSERLQQAGRYGREAVVTAALELATRNCRILPRSLPPFLTLWRSIPVGITRRRQRFWRRWQR